MVTRLLQRDDQVHHTQETEREERHSGEVMSDEHETSGAASYGSTARPTQLDNID